MSIETKLAELGLTLPDIPKPIGNYRPAKVIGSLVMTSGQTARINGVRNYVGTIGAEVSLDEGHLSARDAALNTLACMKSAIGDLDRIAEIVKLTGYVNAVPGFEDQPSVLNGASDLYVKLFGDAGAHVRVAVGVSSLPGNASVEIEVTAALR
jgi:enamine deaminase RidA (YjgF/YER057c/UK114 family)